MLGEDLSQDPEKGRLYMCVCVCVFAKEGERDLHVNLYLVMSSCCSREHLQREHVVDFSRTSGRAGKEAESALRRSCGSEMVLSLRGH